MENVRQILKKRIALLVLIILIVNMFSPYSLLLKEVKAVSDVVPDPVVVFNKIQDITEKNGNKFFKVQIAVVGDVNINGIDVKFSFDDTKIQPANKNTGKATTAIGMISETYPDMASGSYGKKLYDSSTGTFRITYGVGGGHDLPSEGFSAGEGWEDIYEGYDTWAADFDYYLPIITYTFRLVDTSLTDDDITTDLFTLEPVTGSLPTGAQIVYFNTSGVDLVYNINGISGAGFASPAKTVDTIIVKTNPTNTTYNHNDNVDLTGGVITVNYTNGTSEDIDMTDPNVSITSGSQANVNDPNVEIRYNGKTTTFPITVNDPIDSFVVSTPMTNSEYNHDEALDFTGLQLKATKRSGATILLSQNDTGVITSELTANMNSANFTPSTTAGTVDGTGTQKIVFEYAGLSTYQTIIVNDVVSNIVLESQPIKTIYKRKESLDLTGSCITVNMASGASTTISLPDGGVTVGTYSSTTVEVKQHLKVTFAGKTATDTIDVEAYNYITSSQLTEPVKYEYNIGENLSVAGGSLKLNWSAGNVTNVSLTTDMVSGFDSSTEGTKILTVSYNPQYTLSDGTVITDTITKTFQVDVVNSITSVTITAPSKTTYNHAEALDLTGGIITLTYADGTTSTENISLATITEADGTTTPNMSPDASEFGTETTITKTLKIKYTTANNVTGTVEYPITIVNDVRSIEMEGTAHKVLYNVKDTLDTSVGQIKVTRAVGTPETVDLSDNRVAVTGFDSSVEVASLPLTVTFIENGNSANTTYNVEVKDIVTSLTMGDLPTKTAYKYNESLDLTGATINVVSGSGPETKTITDDMVSGYDPTILGNQTITVNYGGLTTTFTVNVKDYVTKITLNPANVAGELNDTLADLISENNIQYTVTYAKAGAQTAQTLTENMVETGYDSKSTTAQTLTVTYVDNDTESFTNGQSFTDNLEVLLSNPVESVDIVLPTKTTYKHGDTLDLTGGKVVVTYKDNSTEDIPLTSSKVTDATTGSSVNMSPAASEYNTNGQVTKSIKVEYSQGGKSDTKTYTLTISDYVLDILLVPPTKVTYEYNVNGTLDLTGGSVKKVMASGAQVTPVSLTDASVTVGTFDPTNIGAQIITVEYEGKQDSFGVRVENNIQSIEMKATPKTQYKHGETLDVTGGTIVATRSNGTTETITLTLSMVSEFDSTIIGPQILTVTYEGKTTTYGIEIKDYVTGITITKPTKLVYKIGDIIDLTGGKVNLELASKTSTTPVDMADDEVTISGFDTTSEGAKTITVEYKGFSENFAITVIDELSDVVINSLPYKTDYLYGEQLDLSGATLEVKKESGASEIINITKDMVSGYNPKKLGEQKIIVTYEEFTQEFIVKVSDYVTKLQVKEPEKIEYEYGEELDLTKGTVSIIMASGETAETADMTVSMLSGYDKTKTGKQTIKVNYKGLEGSFQVNVTDTVKGISMNTEPNKIVYNYGESLDVTGATITVVKSSGVDTVNVTKDMVSGYNENKSGTQIITVTYKGFTAKFIVMVEKEVVVEPDEPTNPDAPVEPDEPTNPDAPVEPVVPSKPATPSRPNYNINNNTNTELPKEDVDTPIVEEPEIKEEPVEKPEEDSNNIIDKEDSENTVGKTDTKDEEKNKKDDKASFGWDTEEIIASGIAGLAVLILLLLIFFKRNVKVYVVEGDEFVFGGFDRITKKSPELNIDKFLDKETYPNMVRVKLSNSISKKLDGKEIQIKHRGNVIVHRVQYRDEAHVFMLK